MPVRSQADADLNQVIVLAVVRRMPAIEFRTATSAGLAGLKDQDVLAVAARDGRVTGWRVVPPHGPGPPPFAVCVRNKRYEASL